MSGKRHRDLLLIALGYAIILSPALFVLLIALVLGLVQGQLRL